MAMPPSLYLGPYAEWLVTENEVDDRYYDLPARSDPWVLKDNAGQRPGLTVEGVERSRLAVMPNEPRAGYPDLVDVCDFHASEVRDVRGVAYEAEIGWFAETYRGELAEIAAHFGRPPVFRWGLVYYP